MRRRSSARPMLLGALGLAFALAASAAPGCSTDAVAVDACRDIEDARCEAGAQCGLVEDVAACKRYYNDHCLHGLDLEEEPKGRDVSRCAASIRAAGSCQAAGTALAECDLGAIINPARIQEVCDVVQLPEEVSSCAFLIELDPEEVEADAGADVEAGADASSDATVSG